jgi:hypothetical protein
MTELHYTGPKASETAPLWERYPTQNREQPAFLELDPEDGRVRFSYNPEVGPPYGVPMNVWHGLIRRWSCPSTLKGERCVELFEALKPLLERVQAGFSSHWDGRNYVGRLTDDAAEAEEAIEATLQREYEHMEDHAQVWDAQEWFWGDMSLHGVANSADITADMTDEQIALAAEHWIGVARDEGVFLDGDLEDVITDIRDKLKEEKDADKD